MDYKNKKVVIFGLGNYKDGSGISAAEFFVKAGAKIIVTDLKTEKQLNSSLKRLQKFPNIKYILGEHRKKDFQNADFIFKNPGVPKDSPYLEIARKNKIPIINDWTIYFQEKPDNLLIGITGTKGKSTATTLIYEILKKAKKDTVLCGNIGQSPLALLNKIKKHTIVVAELSSWLLQEFKTIKKSPQISIITNLMPEHQDKYKNLQEYYRDKENIFIFQNKNGYLILNKNDKNLQKITKKVRSKIIWYDEKPQNAGIVVAKILKIPKTTVIKTIKNFKGLWGRLQLVKEKSGVKYYNDTTATMPDATIYALRQLGKTCPERSQRIILIAGGMDKKLNYKNLVKEIPKYCKTLILFKGTASEKIIKELEIIPKNNKVYFSWTPPTSKDIIKRRGKLEIQTDISSMQQAVKTAENYSKKGDIILLSPASASFNMFKNEFDRGEQFVKTIKNC